MKKTNYIEAYLTPEEVARYAEGGYTVEEIEDGGGTYTVKDGDTFNQIAYDNGITPEQLAAANPGIKDRTLITIGQVLNLPEVKEEAVSTDSGDDIYLRQAFAESSFRPNVISGKTKSPVGALGLTQLMPSTVKELKELGLVGADFDPLDAIQAVQGQKLYMNWLSERPYLDKGEDFVKQAKFLAAYNAGPGTVKAALTKAKAAGVDIYNTLDWVDTKYLPQQETVDYINKITGKDEKFNKDFEKAKAKESNKYILDLYKQKLGGDPPDYDELMKAYKKAISDKEAYEKQYALDLQTYKDNLPQREKEKAEYDRKLYEYNQIQDRYKRNQEFLEDLNLRGSYPNYDEIYDESDERGYGVYGINSNTPYQDRMPISSYDKARYYDKGHTDWAYGSVDDKTGVKTLKIHPAYIETMKKTGDDPLRAPDESKAKLYEEFITNDSWGGLGSQQLKYPNQIIYFPKPNIRKPIAPTGLEAPKYNPPTVPERPEIPITKLDIIQPKFVGNYSEAPEIVEGDFDNDYKAKRVVDKVKTYKVNKKGKLRRGPFGTQTTRSVRYEIPEEEPLYPENFVPRFFSEGGSALTDWAMTQQDRWSGIKESDAKGEDILKEYNQTMGVTYNPTDAWSAITISNAVMADMGVKSGADARALGFNPSKSHSTYVSNAFKTNQNPDFKYNRYSATRLGETPLSVGNILVKGRAETKDWTYDDFANSKSGYKSHGDIIVDKGSDDTGEYIVLGGGNISDTYKNEKVYVKDLDKKGYKVQLNDSGVKAKTPEKELPPQAQPVVEKPAKAKSPFWWLSEEKEEVAAVPETVVEQEEELPWGIYDQLPAEYKQALFGEGLASPQELIGPRAFNEGGIIRPAGDPWEYKKEGDKYLTRRRGSDSWITATGNPEKAIKELVYKEGVSSEPADTSKKSTGKQSWKDVKEGDPGAEVYQKSWRLLKADNQLSEEDLNDIRNVEETLGYKLNWDAPPGSEDMWIETDKSRDIQSFYEDLDNSGGGYYHIKTGAPAENPYLVKDDPNFKYHSKKEIDNLGLSLKASSFDKFSNPIAYARSLYQGKPMETGDYVISDLLGYDKDDDSWTKFGIDMGEVVAPDLALSYVAPWTIPLTAFGTGVALAANFGPYSQQKLEDAGLSGTQYIDKDVTDKWETAKKQYSSGSAWRDIKRDLKRAFSFEDGGALELTEEQAKAYAKMGYIVEEIK